MFAGETRSTGKVHPRPRYFALRPVSQEILSPGNSVARDSIS